MRLSDYIIDTQGLLPPEQVMMNKKVFDNRSKKSYKLYNLEDYMFKKLDNECRYYQFKAHIAVQLTPGHLGSYVKDLDIDDKMLYLLYD